MGEIFINIITYPGFISCDSADQRTNGLYRRRMPIIAHRRSPVHNPYRRKRSCLRRRLFFLAVSTEYRYSHYMILYDRARLIAFVAYISDRAGSRTRQRFEIAFGQHRPESSGDVDPPRTGARD